LPANARIKPAPEVTSDEDAAQIAEVPDHFTIALSNGKRVTCHKPRTVLKLLLRRILTPEEMRDNEIVEIAKALLCITSFDGVKPPMRTSAEFEACLSRFGSDEDVDLFMNEWQKLQYPEVHDALTKAAKDGMNEGLYGKELEDFVAKRIQEIAKDKLEAVK
jgi:hypothetical protein